MSDEELIELRAALIQIEKTLETERACIIRIRRVLERRLGVEEKKEIVILERDSIAGIITN